MKNKTEKYSSALLSGILEEISPEEQEKTDKRMLLAARIDDAIKARNLSKKQLALAMGKQPSEITKWLSGTHNFTIDTLFDLERILKTNLVQTKENRQVNVINYQASVQVVVKPGMVFDPELNISRFVKYSVSAETKQPSC